MSFVNKTFIVKSLYTGTNLDERDKDVVTTIKSDIPFGEMPRATGK